MLVELVSLEMAYRVANNVAHNVANRVAHRMTAKVANRMTNKRAELPPFFVGAKFLAICLSTQAPALLPR